MLTFLVGKNKRLLKNVLLNTRYFLSKNTILGGTVYQMSDYKLRISKNRPCTEDEVCHNRWHPDIPPVLEMNPGETIEIEVRDALDNQISRNPGTQEFEKMSLGVAHPMTGPIYVNGAEPGDLLVVKVLEIETNDFGYSAIIPGFGFLRENFTNPFKARWFIENNQATSPEIPNVVIPGDPFLGVMGVAPSKELMKRIMERERALAEKGELVMLPDPEGAAPPKEPFSTEGLRTIPPRENGGNMDVRELSVGSIVYFPVFVKGALFSAGDMHFAQGDGEVCGTAVETGGKALLRIEVVKDGAKKYGIKSPVYRPSSTSINRFNNYIVATGHGVELDRVSAENATLSAKTALTNLIDILVKMGYTREQAYIITSVAADLRLSQVVDVPNFTVSAMLPMDIFVKKPFFP